MHYRSVEDMNQVILRNLYRVPADVELIVGIPRSGLLAANLLSLYLNRPLTDLAGLCERRVLGNGKRPIRTIGDEVFDGSGRILVVDDCVSQGTEMYRARAIISEAGLSERTTFLSVFSFPERSNVADVVMQVIARPMCFQWSIMHTPELESCCLDIDGVLCVDCPQDDDDDGPRYQRFLQTATPLFLPTVEVGSLVTCRLEKYRELTQQWLTRHHVRYRELIMMDMPTKEARERSGQHAQYKADVYRRTGAILFIESSPGLAEQIAHQSGLPVLSMVSNRMIGKPDYDRAAIVLARASYLIRRARGAPRKIARWILSAGHRRRLNRPTGA